MKGRGRLAVTRCPAAIVCARARRRGGGMAFSDTEGWRLGILFLVFVGVSVAFMQANRALEAHLRQGTLPIHRAIFQL